MPVYFGPMRFKDRYWHPRPVKESRVTERLWLRRVSLKHGLMLSASACPGNPYDGHIPSAVLEQATNLMQDRGVTIKPVVANLGFIGKEVDADNPGVQIVHRGRYKSLSQQEQRWLKRRHAAEPAIGQLKSVYRLDRCWLKGEPCDALHAINCAAGYSVRWLLRPAARPGVGPASLRLLRVVLWAVRPVSVWQLPGSAAPAAHLTAADSGAARLEYRAFAPTFG